MNRFGGKMTIIRSRILPILLMLVSIAGFAFTVVSFLCIEDDKYFCIADGLFLGFLFLAVSTSHVEYNDDIILYKLWVLKKQIYIREIKEINYGWMSSQYMLYDGQDMFWLPALWTKKKEKKMFEHIKCINPNVQINVSI